MKKCSYCGKKFPDEATVCDIDAQLLQPDMPAPIPTIAATIAHPARKELSYVDPLRTGLVFGILYGVMGLIFAPFFIVMMLVGAFAGKQNAVPGIVLGLFGMIFMPVAYGVLGAIFGIIGALVYNLIAKFTGGLKFEVRDAAN
jgi:hypothetical protein